MNNVELQTFLVTGCAGFIGSRVAQILLDRENTVVGLDNLNNAYSPQLKKWRLAQLELSPNFRFNYGDLGDLKILTDLFRHNNFDVVMNLAARAGVRASVENPRIYIETNIGGTLNLLELCREFEIQKFLLASTSSLYANNTTPYTENQSTDTPLSPYSASKKGAESLAFTYHYLNNLNVIIPRYFTVYGPAGRPEMSILKFIHHITEGLPIPVYGDGNQERDFTYVDDIAYGSIAAIQKLAGFEIINLGSSNPVKLNYVIQLIEQSTGRKATIEHYPRHSADISATWANITKAKRMLSWFPQVSIEKGIEKTVEWYKENRGWLIKALSHP